MSHRTLTHWFSSMVHDASHQHCMIDAGIILISLPASFISQRGSTGETVNYQSLWPHSQYKLVIAVTLADSEGSMASSGCWHPRPAGSSLSSSVGRLKLAPQIGMALAHHAFSLRQSESVSGRGRQRPERPTRSKAAVERLAAVDSDTRQFPLWLHICNWRSFLQQAQS